MQPQVARVEVSSEEYAENETDERRDSEADEAQTCIAGKASE